MEYLTDFRVWSRALATEIASVANPALDLSKRATKGWVMTELDDALLAVGAYAIIVIIGMILMDNTDSGKSKDKSAKDEPPPSSSLSWSEVARRFAEKPFMMTAKMIYNTTQVVLCMWMVVFSFQHAWKAGYPQYVMETVS
jgi:hypothetical protein